jgi:hypothetical protein
VNQLRQLMLEELRRRNSASALAIYHSLRFKGTADPRWPTCDDCVTWSPPDICAHEARPALPVLLFPIVILRPYEAIRSAGRGSDGST